MDIFTQVELILIGKMTLVYIVCLEMYRNGHQLLTTLYLIYIHQMLILTILQMQEMENPSMKRKVVKGGSWKDVASFLEVGARDYEYQDSA